MCQREPSSLNLPWQSVTTNSAHRAERSSAVMLQKLNICNWKSVWILKLYWLPYNAPRQLGCEESNVIRPPWAALITDRLHSSLCIWTIKPVICLQPCDVTTWWILGSRRYQDNGSPNGIVAIYHLINSNNSNPSASDRLSNEIKNCTLWSLKL